MSLKTILFSSMLFAAGTCYGERIRHTAASLFADQPLPYAAVDFTSHGTFVNGEPVTTDHVGSVRCDWHDIGAVQREDLAVEELIGNPLLLETYFQRVQPEERRRMVYTGLTFMARDAGSSISDEINRMRESMGFRFESSYNPTLPSLSPTPGHIPPEPQANTPSTQGSSLYRSPR